MAQVLKPEVRDRILHGAATTFADRGYEGASMAAIARASRTAAANVYRYFPDKAALFDAVVPRALVDRHDALLDARVGALVEDGPARAATADDLLAFWIEHRLAVVILLEGAAGTPYADYPDRFVERLMGHVAAPAHHHRVLLRIVFDNTRRALAQILRSETDPDGVRALVAGFWSYQLPGLAGLAAWMAAP